MAIHFKWPDGEVAHGLRAVPVSQWKSTTLAEAWIAGEVAATA